ncbi:GLPGLI family protein [Porphyromonas gingivalis]|uniref:GLPGLI family protein n=2 Tax=Porphyromonas gingivalis TaxID=837 RepID=UPI001F38FF00|nr:GLPGLI family protein [Porphyromonas gingivalis]MCE8182016.1 GLPGLI family protein [Porphyromonas gingivalis]
MKTNKTLSMKRTLLFLASCFFMSMSFIQAQVPRIVGAEGMPVDTVPKRVEDYTKQRFFYKVSFVKDTTRRDKETQAQCVLEIGQRGSCFKDFYEYAADSVNDAVARKKGTAMEIFSKAYDYVKKTQWRTPVLKGYPSGQDYHQYGDPIVGSYEYGCPSPVFEWSIGEETKEIMGYTCRKATCHHSGRDYTAWYAEDIALSDGPYIFRGLPGLIVAIGSDDGEYVFELNGMQEITFPSPIYFKKNAFTKVGSREEMRKTIRNIHEHYAEVVANSPAFVNSPIPVDFSHLPPQPFNPLEKE